MVIEVFRWILLIYGRYRRVRELLPRVFPFFAPRESRHGRSPRVMHPVRPIISGIIPPAGEIIFRLTVFVINRCLQSSSINSFTGP